MGHRLEEGMAVAAVEEETPKIGKRSALGAFEESEDGIPKNAVHLIAPARRESLEHADKIGCEQGLLEVGMCREDIEANGILFVGRIDEDDIGNAVLGNDAEDFVHKIAVWIEDGDALAVLDVLADEIEKKGRFTGAGSSDNVAMANPLLGRQTHFRHSAGVHVRTKNQ